MSNQRGYSIFTLLFISLTISFSSLYAMKFLMWKKRIHIRALTYQCLKSQKEELQLYLKRMQTFNRSIKLGTIIGAGVSIVLPTASLTTRQAREILIKAQDIYHHSKMNFLRITASCPGLKRARVLVSPGPYCNSGLFCKLKRNAWKEAIQLARHWTLSIHSRSSLEKITLKASFSKKKEKWTFTSSEVMGFQVSSFLLPPRSLPQ